MSIDEFVAKFGGRFNLYHFTDIRNLDSIGKYGLLCLAELKKRGVTVSAPGGNDWSHEEDERRSLDQYVHLCMRNQHPMEFKAKNEGRLGETKFLKIEMSSLLVPGIMFTSEVANKANVPLLTWDQAVNTFDWEVLYSRTDWQICT